MIFLTGTKIVYIQIRYNSFYKCKFNPFNVKYIPLYNCLGINLWEHLKK